MYRSQVARDEHTLKTWRRHLRLVEPTPEDPVLADWQRTLDEIRADWRKRHREQLLSEQRLNEVSLVNIPTGS